jgi:O-antigen ligase
MTPRRLTALQYAAFAVLAIFLNGLLVWNLAAPHAMPGGRGALTGVAAIALLAAVGVVNGYRFTRHGQVLAWLLVAQMAVFLAALQIGGASAYGQWKVQGFILFAALPALLLLWIVPRRPRLAVVLYHGLFAAAFLPFLVLLPYGLHLLNAGSMVPWLLRQDGVDTIGMSRTLGLGAFLAVAFALPRKGLTRLMLLGCAGAMVVAQWWIGQRGPLLALAVSVLYLFLIITPLRVRIPRRLRRGLVAALLLAVVLALPRVLPRVQWDTVAHDPRVQIGQRWLGMFLEHPLLGIGVGAFNYGRLQGVDPLQTEQSDRAYAHNIFGELLSESGLLGFGAFLLFLVLTFRFARLARAGLTGEPLVWHQTSLGLVVYALAAAQVSGDLTTNYLVWISLALAYATAVPGAVAARAAEVVLPWAQSRQAPLWSAPTPVPLRSSGEGS